MMKMNMTWKQLLQQLRRLGDTLGQLEVAADALALDVVRVAYGGGLRDGGVRH